MTTRLSPFEVYYRDAGLGEYERVFEYSRELATEAEICADRMAGWRGLGRETLRVLDIGCGFGTFTRNLFTGLFASRPAGELPRRITIDAIDINAGASAMYASRLNGLGERIEIGRMLCAPWQDLSQTDLAENYDLVIANHVFYGCTLNRELLEAIFSLLPPHGMVLLALAARSSSVYRMRREAGILINCGEDIGAALVEMQCNFSRTRYASRLYFNPEQPLFHKWLFVNDEAGPGDRSALLQQHVALDQRGTYVVSRGQVYVAEPADDSAESE